MLHGADRLTEIVADDPIVASPPKLALVRPDAAATPGILGSRYGMRRGVNVPMVVLLLLVHIILIAALMQARHYVRHVREVRLSVVNLMPPPPPPAAEVPPPPSQPKVVAPPLVQVPTPMQAVATTPDIAPVPAAIAPVPAPAPVVASFAPPAPPGILEGGELGTQMVAGRPPRYPVESRRKREQGTVVLTLTLGVGGTVESLAVTRSSGFSRLDKAAGDAVRSWRWKPTIRDGQPVRVKGIVEIPFVLLPE
ncbi:energy transducer TonB [Sphingobium sp. EM0848]|uniref:energy transducer TonB n=1 Tax=Sphingobium sp. EM0848 TaxID=2743473 RepID=UPI00159CA03E|nr:energy transducer TonB [Sphingobium sp. EM0848]